MFKTVKIDDVTFNATFGICNCRTWKYITFLDFWDKTGIWKPFARRFRLLKFDLTLTLRWVKVKMPSSNSMSQIIPKTCVARQSKPYTNMLSFNLLGSLLATTEFATVISPVVITDKAKMTTFSFTWPWPDLNNLNFLKCLSVLFMKGLFIFRLKAATFVFIIWCWLRVESVRLFGLYGFENYYNK